MCSEPTTAAPRSHSATPKRDITDLLGQWREGDHHAGDRLMELIYAELKAIAAGRLPRRAARSMDTTELVHETYLRLSGQTRLAWKNRAHFFALAARMTRRVVIDHVRQHSALKRGGDAREVPLTGIDASQAEGETDWEALDEALLALAEVDQDAEKIVVYRYFAGMTIDEVGEVLGMSPSTVSRRWRFARAFLERRLDV